MPRPSDFTEPLRWLAFTFFGLATVLLSLALVAAVLALIWAMLGQPDWLVLGPWPPEPDMSALIDI